MEMVTIGTLNGILDLAGVVVSVIFILLSIAIERDLTEPFFKRHYRLMILSFVMFGVGFLMDAFGEYIGLNPAVVEDGHDTLLIASVIIMVFATFNLLKEVSKYNHAKSEFLSLASHQLRTPPSIINWYTETLRSGDLGPINDRQAKYLKEIDVADQRMIATINALLNISRMEMGTFAFAAQKADIKDIIRETIKAIKSRYDGRLTVRTDYNTALGFFNTDPALFQIILDNLLSNAIKYSPPDGTAITIGATIKKEVLTLSVADNGIGIPAKYQNRIFEKIFRADNAISMNPEGNGIGLYMTKKIIDGLGGRIWFESKENNGTTFYISLPAHKGNERSGSAKLTQNMRLTN
jgi:signal transduction histidine kinase